MCPESTVLAPAVIPASELTRRRDNAADYGTLAHHWKSTGQILDHRYARLFEKHVEECGIDRLALWPPGGRHDVAVAVDCASDSFREHTGSSQDDRNAWKDAQPESWVTGEWDYCGEILGMPWVDDLKTGRPHDPSEPQTVFYGLGAWLSARRLPSRVCLTVTNWRRPNLDAKNPRAFPPPVRTPDLWVSADDLADFRRRVILAYQLRGLGELNSGPQCLYCPADCIYQGAWHERA